MMRHTVGVVDWPQGAIEYVVSVCCVPLKSGSAIGGRINSTAATTFARGIRTAVLRTFVVFLVAERFTAVVTHYTNTIYSNAPVNCSRCRERCTNGSLPIGIMRWSIMALSYSKAL